MIRWNLKLNCFIKAEMMMWKNSQADLRDSLLHMHADRLEVIIAFERVCDGFQSSYVFTGYVCNLPGMVAYLYIEKLLLSFLVKYSKL